jgi:hypothetical protein
MPRKRLALGVALAALAVLPASSGAKARWYYLGTQTLEIDGRPYPRSVETWPSLDPVQFNLRRRCSALAFTAGILDSEPQDSQVEFSVLGDGGEIETLTLPFGQAASRVVGVRGVLRLGLDAAELQGNPYIGFGRARAKCTRPPTAL